MKKNVFLYDILTTFFIVLMCIGFLSCSYKKKCEKNLIPRKFSFAFFTDVHLLRENDRNSHNGFKIALDDVLNRNVDFILFGGDNIDAYNLKESGADSLYNWFKREVDKRDIKAYYTIGNHDASYIPNNVENDPNSFKLHEKYFNDLYFSFDYKDIHFIILNSIVRDSEHKFCVGEEQRIWLENDLKKIGTKAPVVISIHVPIQSLYYPAVEGRIIATDMISDFKKVWDILDKYNVKIILQGHQHLYEELFVKDMQFLTGGAVCGNWWSSGDFYKTDKGYLLIDVDENNNFKWNYIVLFEEKNGKNIWQYSQGASQYDNK